MIIMIMMKNLHYSGMLLFLLIAAAMTHYLLQSSERERVPPRVSLAEFPTQIGEWREIDAQTLGAGQTRELKADEYISRTYADGRGAFAYLFIAYYASQRHRQTIHSPQNCIPAAGWVMGEFRKHKLAQDRQINEYLIEKDGVKMLAFYWYQGRGRVEASEYLSRFYTIEDAVFRGRTDGAIVRVIVPMSKGDGAEGQARKDGLGFSEMLLGALSSYIPD